ncbi:MAG TPA: sigma-54 dependent transcriptional regulator [Kofleriaceae bacterium]|jgi:two-component system response regulator HydG
MNGSILVVDDDFDTASLFADGLRRRGLNVSEVFSGKRCLQRLGEQHVDVVVTDMQMPEMNGIELCDQIRETHPDVLSIIVTGFGSMDTAIEAIRAGAYDFITKPVKIDALAIAISRALEHLTLKREVLRLRNSGDAPAQGHSLIAGTSSAIKETIEMVERVASSDATVLIAGESGTGKELVARALHEASSRRNEPFVAINCAAMPAPLLESELFGHVRGAFTDAKVDRPGLFAQTKRGTLFLDEIAEMPLEMQAKLLRVLQERVVRPVGSDVEQPFEGRIVAATNRRLEQEVGEKRFREDLFYRINVVSIPVPPLRVRSGDILSLAQLFLVRSAKRNNKDVVGISPAAARMLQAYDWPGNVRELENCMERAVALSRLDEITVEELPRKIQEHSTTRLVLGETPPEMITLAEMERRYVHRVLDLVNGNKTHAARVLGIDRRSLYRRLAVTVETQDGAAEPAPE